MEKISFNTALNLAGKQFIKEKTLEYQSLPSNSVHFTLKFRIRMWLMFQKYKFINCVH